MAKIVFFCHSERSTLDTVEYYRQDIDALNTLGHQLIICTKYSEIPLYFDAIFIWWWTLALWPVLLGKLLNKPSIITGTYNFSYPKEFSGKDYFHRPLWQKLLIGLATRLSDLNLFVNRLEYETCSKYFKLKNARYYPHIIGDDYISDLSGDKRKVLFNVAWSGKENLLRKGIPELLQAVRHLKDQKFNTQLIMAGEPGDGLDLIYQMIRDLQLEEDVKYLGKLSRTEKIDLLRKCEVYVQPSHYEGFGVAIAEAMACGACVITCDVGGVRDVVGDCGIYVSPNSPKELAEAIRLALCDDELRSQLQNRAHRRIKEHFTSKRKIDMLKEYLLEIGIT